MLKVLLAQIKEYKADSIKTPILVMGEVVFDILIPFLMARLVDDGINKGDMQTTWLYAGFMLLCAIIALVLGGLSGKYAAAASCGFAKTCGMQSSATSRTSPLKTWTNTPPAV